MWFLTSLVYHYIPLLHVLSHLQINVYLVCRLLSVLIFVCWLFIPSIWVTIITRVIFFHSILIYMYIYTLTPVSQRISYIIQTYKVVIYHFYFKLFHYSHSTIQIYSAIQTYGTIHVYATIYSCIRYYSYIRYYSCIRYYWDIYHTIHVYDTILVYIIRFMYTILVYTVLFIYTILLMYFTILVF